MNLKTAAVLIALTLPLAACGNKGPLVLAPKPAPVAEPAQSEPAPPAEASTVDAPVTADDAPPAAEPTASDTPPPPPPADGTPADRMPNG